jgi:hypothetical protein
MTIEVLFTTDMKLQAMAHKYYSGIKWEPKAGDYYTSSRADLELYKVIEVTDTKVKTVYVKPDSEIAEWDKDGFTNEGFGLNRVYVPDFVFRLQNNIFAHANDYAKTICAKHPEQVGDTELILQQLIIKAKTGLI